MPEELPESHIVPIIRTAKAEPIKQLLGTGFFVGRPGSLQILTAKHVIESNPLQPGEGYAVAFGEKSGIRIRSIDGYQASSKYDFAFINGEGFPEASPLPIVEGIAPLNVDVVTNEYSTTRIERLPDGRAHVSIEPLLHKGNVMTYYVSNFPETVPTPSLLTSFPALQGASGAPVILSHNFAVIGILMANFERHLLPAQVVRVSSSDAASAAGGTRTCQLGIRS